jgi:simple sugar transport system ATP-binding protein
MSSAGGPDARGPQPVRRQSPEVHRRAARSTLGPQVLIVSQPTWGVDVGAAAQIRAELLALRDAGCAVLVVSEELDELFEICDRLVRDRRGRLSPDQPVAATSVARIGEWMSGLWDADSKAVVATGGRRMIRLEPRAAAVRTVRAGSRR